MFFYSRDTKPNYLLKANSKCANKRQALLFGIIVSLCCCSKLSFLNLFWIYCSRNKLDQKFSILCQISSLQERWNLNDLINPWYQAVNFSKRTRQSQSRKSTKKPWGFVNLTPRCLWLFWERAIIVLLSPLFHLFSDFTFINRKFNLLSIKEKRAENTSAFAKFVFLFFLIWNANNQCDTFIATELDISNKGTEKTNFLYFCYKKQTNIYSILWLVFFFSKIS